jgi:hypothetical protein
MGYEVCGKVISHKVTKALRRRVPSQAVWTRVGDNAEMLAWSKLKLDFCRYPLDIGRGLLAIRRLCIVEVRQPQPLSGD